MFLQVMTADFRDSCFYLLPCNASTLGLIAWPVLDNFLCLANGKTGLDLKLLTCKLRSFFYLRGAFFKIDNAPPTVTKLRLLN